MKSMIKSQPEDTRTPQQRFKDLAKEVFSVSKEEIDKRQAEYDKQNKKTKKQKPNPYIVEKKY